MSNLKEIRTRITSVKTTRQVTSAMKMVSAAKLKKAQDAIIRIRPYAGKLHEILSLLSESLEGSADDSPYTVQREPVKVLIVLLSSNRGLCGAFNSSISKRAWELATTTYKSQLREGNVSFLAIGKQGERFLKSRKSNIPENANHLYDHLTFEQSAPLAEKLMAGFIKGQYDRVILVYNQFKNAAIQVAVTEQFLPVEMPANNGKTTTKANFIFEPSEKEIVTQLIPRSLKIQFYKALLDSYAAEHGARMTAMHQATDNATELIRELTITFNKARQAAITNEILEVTNGAEALR